MIKTFDDFLRNFQILIVFTFKHYLTNSSHQIVSQLLVFIAWKYTVRDLSTHRAFECWDCWISYMFDDTLIVKCVITAFK